LGPGAFGYSPDFRRLAKADSTAWQIVHTHGLWMYPGAAARQIARAAKCPLVISPHGMLEPWAINNSRWKKKIAGWLFESRNLRSASCLHALCMPEADNIRRYGLKSPIAIIPNGVMLDEIHPLPDHDAIVNWSPGTRGKRRVLFLSRLHPKKGLANLLNAWARLQNDFQDWVLAIAGSGARDYEEELRKLAASLGIEKSTFFLGAVYGERKREALSAADLFVLPSFSEGLSMATLEASAAGLAVLQTKECHFQQLTNAGAAIEVPATAAGVETGLRHLLDMSSEQRRAMGEKGLALVKGSYTWTKIAAQMIGLYQWLRHQGPLPEFIRMN
jgi:poly(glycerol-phosphate) alpha-glucosyltransferase